MESFVRRSGRLRTLLVAALAGAAALAGVTLACGGGDGDGTSEAEGPRRDNWIADTQYMQDSLGNDLMVIIRRPPGAAVEVEPRAGSGDPDAPGAVERLEPREAATLIQNIQPRAYIIDVRDSESYVRLGWIPGSFLIEHDQLEENIAEIHVRTDQMIIVYGDDDGRTEAAARLLASYGFPTVRWIRGGFLQWAALDLPTEGYSR